MSTIDVADVREAVPWFALDVVVVWEERVPPGERKKMRGYIQHPFVYELKNYLALQTVLQNRIRRNQPMYQTRHYCTGHNKQWFEYW